MRVTLRESEQSALWDARSAYRVGAGRRGAGQSVRVAKRMAQAAGFAAGRAVLGKDGLLAGLKAAMNVRRRGGAALRLAMGAALATALLVPNATESAVANGDTRTVIFSTGHTSQSGSFT